MIKPDGVQRSLVGEIIDRFEEVDAKKQSRDLVERNRHAGRSEGKPERESKRETLARQSD